MSSQTWRMPQSPPTMAESSEGGDAMSQLLSILSRLSPSNQRLVRELTWKLAQLEQQTIPEEYDSNLDFHRYINPWITSLLARGFSGRTIPSYRATIEALLGRAPKPKRAHIEAYLASLQVKGLSLGTINRQVSAVKSFFGYLADRDMISATPAAKIARPRLPRLIRKAPTEQVFTALMQIPKSHRHQTMLLIFADCGIRLSELATIRISDIDLEHASIKVFGKGSKERIVPLSAHTTAAVEKQLKALAETGYDGEWLFPGIATGSHYSIRGIDQYFDRLSHRLGVKVTPHQLRHYFATYALSKGASIKAISAILGHADTSTTADVYWHILNEEEIIAQHNKYSPIQ